MMNTGIIMIVSGPSGSGKGTICTELSKKREDVYISVSVTTRPPRAEEVEGKSYYFKTKEEFEEMIRNDELIEWVKYCDNYYGTPKQNIEIKRNEGKNVILEIEVEGALNIKKKYPDSVLVFVFPPNYDELIKRLKGRGSEKNEEIEKRIRRATYEMSMIENYDYVIINDDIHNAVSKLESIIDAEKCKVNRNWNKIKEFIESIKEV